ncbi:MAG: methionine adenosyltransferase [Armatimonadetes bacterium]|nr:methionine adenosyltransferase [Armatimonadota bacterium]
MSKRLVTSESVTEGHPDKVADQISDAVLDECLRQDPMARVALEALLTRGLVVVAGEVTVNGQIDFAGIARRVVSGIGYTSTDVGMDGETCGVAVAVQKQSAHIAMGVDTGGAGDQGMMIGYACNETDQLMPLPIMIAHRMTKMLADVRKQEPNLGLRPDGKTQVSVVYEGGTPKSIETVVVSTQHEPRLDQAAVRDLVMSRIVNPVLSEFSHKIDIVPKHIHVNPTGKFEIGGPQGDTGLTGRKIIVDTYGGICGHGGGAFSGKDATKVDRSAAYIARYIAKNIVAAGLADRVETHLAYAIGVAQPVALNLETFGTHKVDPERLSAKILDAFDLSPKGIIERLDLRKPQFEPTAKNGHFGNPAFRWEQTDAAEIFRSLA